MLECVANVSEGRDQRVLAAFIDASADALLDLHVDPDHHRAVFTLVGTNGVRGLAEAVAEHVDLASHVGVHPRLGALDVVPFVALTGSTANDAVAAARDFGTWLASTGVPVFFYDEADERRRSLPSVRRDAFVTRPPDLGPTEPHPALGATAVGARPVLVAVNCELDTADAGIASAIAREIRGSSGGLPGVRALGFMLESRARAQVSMNLVALERTGLETACEAVRTMARQRGAHVERVELVGLLPSAELARCSEAFLSWSGLGPRQTIESRLTVAAVQAGDAPLEA